MLLKRSMPSISHLLGCITSVDGGNPAPLGTYKNAANHAINYLSTGERFLPSIVSRIKYQGHSLYPIKTKLRNSLFLGTPQGHFTYDECIFKKVSK